MFTSTSPHSRARRKIPWSSGPVKNSGKIVIRSKRMRCQCSQSAERVHGCDDGRTKGCGVLFGDGDSDKRVGTEHLLRLSQRTACLGCVSRSFLKTNSS